MKKRNRNRIFEVSTTRTFKSDNPSPGKEMWDSDDTTDVLAADAEDAIARVRDHFNREDKGDGAIKRRTAFIFNSVTEGKTLDIV